MAHNCFISFKKEDAYYKDRIVEKLGKDRILSKSLDKWIDSEDLDYVMQVIRDEYMKGTSVTLYLIGSHSSENEGLDQYGRNIQSFMIRELQATLYDRKGNPRSGLLGIVLPEMEQKVFGDSYKCEKCGHPVQRVNIDDSTVLREFSQNYWLEDGECDHISEEHRFCVMVRYSEFMNGDNTEYYIDKAFEKTKSPIAKMVHYRDIKHKGIKNYR